MKYPEGRRAFVTFTEQGVEKRIPVLVLEYDEGKGLVGLVTVERVLVAEQIKGIEWADSSENEQS